MAESVYLPYIYAAVAAAGATYTAYTVRQNNTAAAEEAINQAHTARQVGNAREEMVRRSRAADLATQRAAAAQSGFNPNAGSFNDLQGQSAANAELDALTARYEGEMGALDLTSRASAYQREARQATRQGYLSAAGAIMQGTSRYGSSMRMPSGGNGVGTMAGGPNSSTVGMNY